MKDFSAKNRKNTLKLKTKVLLATLTLALMVSLGAAARAAPGDKGNETGESLFSRTDLFNPFTLSSSRYAPERNLGTGIILGASSTRPIIRIPFRPPLRSPFRP